MAVNKKNLRYCQVLYDGTYYDLMIAVTDLDETDQILQDWALNKFEVELDLPSALILNKDATEIITALDIDSYVYIDSPVSAYMELPRFAGISGTLPVLPTALDDEDYYVLPTCLAYLWSHPTMSGYFGEYIIPESQNFTLSEGANFIGIDFNAGEPIYQLYTSFDSINFATIIPVVTVLNFEGSIYNIPYGQTGYGLPEKIMQMMTRRNNFEILDPYIMALSGLYIELGAVVVGYGVEEITCLALDTQTTGHDMYLYYLNGSLEWVSSKIATINNTQYQSPATGIETLGAGNFVVNYIFRAVNDTKRLLFYVLSDTFESLQLAIDSPEITDIPDDVKMSAVCVGRIIIEQGASTALVQTVQKTIFR